MFIENEAEERRTKFILSKIKIFETYGFLSLCGISFSLVQFISYLVLLVPLIRIIGVIVIPLLIIVPGIYGFRDTEEKDYKYLFLSGFNIVSLISTWRHILNGINNNYLIFGGVFLIVIVCVGMGVRRND